MTISPSKMVSVKTNKSISLNEAMMTALLLKAIDNKFQQERSRIKRIIREELAAIEIPPGEKGRGLKEMKLKGKLLFAVYDDGTHEMLGEVVGKDGPKGDTPDISHLIVKIDEAIDKFTILVEEMKTK